jgi:hypothetical protein
MRLLPITPLLHSLEITPDTFLVKCSRLFWGIISDSVVDILKEGLAGARKERQIAPQASAGGSSPSFSPLGFRPAKGGREKISSGPQPNTPAPAKWTYVP